MSDVDLIGLKVKHKTYGIGVVTFQEGSLFTVQFQVPGDVPRHVQFRFPDAFVSKYLSTNDYSISCLISQEIANRTCSICGETNVETYLFQKKRYCEKCREKSFPSPQKNICEVCGRRGVITTTIRGKRYCCQCQLEKYAYSTQRNNGEEFIQRLIASSPYQYELCKGRIDGILHWRGYRIPQYEYSFFKNSDWLLRTKHYSGQRCIYRINDEYDGPEVEVDISVESKQLGKKRVILDIYGEIMEITHYLRMSPKLSASLERAEGRIVDLYICSSQKEVWFDASQLLSLNYGYR